MGANSSRTGAASLSDDDGKSLKVALQRRHLNAFGTVHTVIRLTRRLFDAVCTLKLMLVLPSVLFFSSSSFCSSFHLHLMFIHGTCNCFQRNKMFAFQRLRNTHTHILTIYLEKFKRYNFGRRLKSKSF